MPVRISALGASAKAAPAAAKLNRLASRLAPNSDDLKRDMAASSGGPRGEICCRDAKPAGYGVRDGDHDCGGRCFHACRRTIRLTISGCRKVEGTQNGLRAKDHHRNHRGGAGHGGAGSGEQSVRAACGRPVHHRDRVAGPEAVAVLDAEACRAGDHDRCDGGDLSRLCFSRGLGIWPCRPIAGRRSAAVPGALFGGGDVAGRPWHFGRGAVGRTLQRRLAAARDAAGYDPRQYHAQLLGDRAGLRDARASRSREHQAEDRTAG